jgi:hypothetical protein
MNESLIEDIYPLSPMQEGLLFQSLYDPDPEAYFVQMNFRFRGELQPEPFRDAWLILCARHGVLRSAFLHEGLSRPALAELIGPFQAPIPQVQREASIVEMGEAEAERLLLEKI